MVLLDRISKVQNVQKLVDEQEWKFIHTAKGSMSLLSVVKTMIFVVFFSLLFCCCCLCRCCRNCWLRIMRWWYFDDSTCRTILFKPKVVNSISTTTDWVQKRSEQVSQQKPDIPFLIVSLLQWAKDRW
jgi:hypothetical protein